MTNLKINTLAVRVAAHNIKRLNNEIRGGISDVKEAISRLNTGWISEAAAKTISKFYELDSRFSDARYNVVNNYVNFLQQIGEGYGQTERTNKTLADAFKSFQRIDISSLVGAFPDKEKITGLASAAEIITEKSYLTGADKDREGDMGGERERMKDLMDTAASLASDDPNH